MNPDQQMNKSSMEGLQRSLGYTFKDRDLLITALTHRSFLPETGRPLPDNERLEFLGDAVLELAISDLLFRRFGDTYKEGDLTKMRAYLVSETRLVFLARTIGLGRYLFMGRGEEKCGGRTRPSILADAFEATVGAIYIDGGFRSAYGFVKEQFGSLLESAPEKGLKIDYKSRLQEMIQKHYHCLPAYELLEINGPDHNRRFKVALFFDNREISQGSGRSKKEAEQQAAKIALENLEEHLEENGFG